MLAVKNVAVLITGLHRNPGNANQLCKYCASQKALQHAAHLAIAAVANDDVHGPAVVGLVAKDSYAALVGVHVACAIQAVEPSAPD